MFSKYLKLLICVIVFVGCGSVFCGCDNETLTEINRSSLDVQGQEEPTKPIYNTTQTHKVNIDLISTSEAKKDEDTKNSSLYSGLVTCSVLDKVDVIVTNNKKKCCCITCCMCLGGGLIALLIYYLTRGVEAGGNSNLCNNKCFSTTERNRVVEALAKNKIVENVDFSFCPKENDDFYIFNISRSVDSNDIKQYYTKCFNSNEHIDFVNDFDGLICTIGVKDPQKFFSNNIVREWLGGSIVGIECVKSGTVEQKDFSGLFKNYHSLSYVDILNINLSSVLKMEDMFYGCSNLTTVNAHWQNTSRCTDMSGLFYNCSSLRDIDFFIKTVDVSNVKKMDYLFGGCSKLEHIDLERWWLKSIISMSHFVDNCRNLKSVILPPLLDSLENVSFMFSDCKELSEIYGLESFNPTNVTNMKSMFYGCSSLTGIKLSSLTGSKIDDIEEMFAYCDNVTTISAPSLSIGNVDKYNNCFVGDGRLTKICCPQNDKISSLLADLWDEKNPPYLNGCYNRYLHQCHISDLMSELEDNFVNLGLKKNMDFFWSDLSTEAGVFVFKLNQSCYLSVKRLHVNNKSLFSGIDSLEEFVLVEDNTSDIDTLHQLFKDCKNLRTVDLKGLRDHYATDMSEMFSGCSSIQNIVSLDKLNLSHTTTLSGMFSGCKRLETLDGVKYWDVSQVVDMSRMFENCISLNDISFLEEWDVSHVTTMNRMFYKCSSISTVEHIKEWDTRSLTNIGQLFYKCLSLSEITLDWFTKNITDMNSLFYECANLSSVTISELEINPVCVHDDIFKGCDKIEKVCIPEAMGIKETLQALWSQEAIYKNNCYLKSSNFICQYSDSKEELNNNMQSLGLVENIDYYWYEKTGDRDFFVFQINNDDCYLSCRTLFVNGKSIFNSLLKLNTLKIIQDNKEKVSTAEAMFEDCRNLVSINLKGLDYQNAISVKAMFRNCNSLTSLDLGAFNTENVQTFESMLEGCEKIQWVRFDKVITKKSKSFKNMFKGCRLLTSIDLSLFDSNLAENMAGMFEYCESLTEINLESFVTHNLKDMNSMFKDCVSLKNIVWNKNFDTSRVTNMEYLFYNCQALTYVGLSFFNTLNVKSFGGMFTNCQNLLTLDLSSFDTSNAVNMSFMFYGCNSLTRLSITNFKVSKVTNMSYMFAGCFLLSDLHLWHNSSTTELKKMQYMFFGCGSLVKIDLTYLKTNKVANMDYSFYQCINLKSLNLINFDSSSLTTANYMLANCFSLQEVYANNNFAPNVSVSTANFFQGAYSLNKVCMILNDNMLSSLQDTIGQVIKRDSCYIKKDNLWKKHALNTDDLLLLKKETISTINYWHENNMRNIALK